MSLRSIGLVVQLEHAHAIHREGALNLRKLTVIACVGVFTSGHCFLPNRLSTEVGIMTKALTSDEFPLAQRPAGMTTAYYKTVSSSLA